MTYALQERHNFRMTSHENDQFKKRIAALEKELAIREKDIDHYRYKLSEANVTLEKLTLQMELQLALLLKIQKKLTPTEFSNIPGFEFSFKFVPSKISGGDYFDIFEHETKSRFGIILTSASGYGISAMLLSILLKLSEPLKTKKGGAPSEVIRVLSEELREGMQDKNECHVFYGQVDRSSFDLNYCLAGDLLGLHYKYQQQELDKLQATGSALSKKEPGNLNSMNIHLNPRDRVIICSKGVLDARNKDEFFGEERVYKAIMYTAQKEVHEIRNEILYQIKTFMGKEELPRDVTVFVLEVKDKVIKLARNSDK